MLEKLSQLESNLNELEQFRNSVSDVEIKENIRNQWILRYGLLESIQIVIDISCHLVSKYNLGNPKNYKDCIELLLKNKYITSELSFNITGMVGLRNLLVHEYMEIDTLKLIGLLKKLDHFAEFAYQIRNVI